jgi:RNA polymerase sigma factor (sigma-70 family)
VDHNARTPAEDHDERTAARREEARADAELVARARTDDPDAFGQLYERWFERVHDLAFRITRDASLAADTAQDAFVAAWRNLPKLDDPQVFGGWLLRITRNTALNRRRKELRSSPRDSEGFAVIEATDAPRPDAPIGFRVEDRTARADDPSRAVEDAEVVALVWESAEALGERDAEVLDLTLRHGLTPAEIGEVIGVNRNAANQSVHRVRTRLKAAVQARVLWRDGAPVCGDLADALAAASVTTFSPDAVRIATEHAESCAQCERRRTLKLEPSAIFAATPFLAVPLLKQKVAHALAAQDVPMGGAQSATATDVPEADRAPGRAHDGWRGWRARTLAAAGAVIVVAVAVVVGAEELDDGTVNRQARITPASTERSTSTTSTAAPLPPTELVAPPSTVMPRAATSPDEAAPPAAPPLPPPPPPAPVATGSISVAPSGSMSSTFALPVVSWQTANGPTVEVSGPGLAGSSSATGSVPVCPGSPAGAFCTALPGTYTYVLQVRDGDGAVVVQRSASFTVG